MGMGNFYHRDTEGTEKRGGEQGGENHEWTRMYMNELGAVWR